MSSQFLYRRREFITLLGGGGLLLAAKVRRGRAQQPAMPVIGFLDSRSSDGMTSRLASFRQGLKEVGFVEGENVTIIYRWAEDRGRSSA
jgi:putative tryptophan/tyrosine transport system substrate-binding protein